MQNYYAHFFLNLDQLHQVGGSWLEPRIHNTRILWHSIESALWNDLP